MLDTGAASVFTAGEKQVRALQKKIPDITVDTPIIGKYRIKFNNNPVVEFTKTINVITPLGAVNFAIIFIISFLVRRYKEI
jgi:hypothetical protein